MGIFDNKEKVFNKAKKILGGRQSKKAESEYESLNFAVNNLLLKERIDATIKEIEQMEQDGRILRYLVVGTDWVSSKTLGDCHYIYPKLGMFNNFVSNIDFVKEVYAQHGIILQKHISNLDKKETEVLYIKMSDYDMLSNEQKRFLSDTAPSWYSDSERASCFNMVLSKVVSPSVKLQYKNKMKNDVKDYTMLDKKLLRYRIVDVAEVEDYVRIYPKLGMFDVVDNVPNIDFVKEVYAQHGIILHVDEKEPGVLYIKMSDISKLSGEQRRFFAETAPLPYFYMEENIKRRAKDIGQLAGQAAHPELLPVNKQEYGAR